MTQVERKNQFVLRLRAVASVTRHVELAKSLGVDRSLLRNWLYRDTPNDWAVDRLKPAVDRRYRDLKAAKIIKNGKH